MFSFDSIPKYITFEVKGKKYGIPLSFAAKKRAEYYAQLDVDRGDANDFEAAVKREFEFAMEDSYEAVDYMRGNMSFSDLKNYTVLLKENTSTVESEWNNIEDFDVEEITD